MSNSLGSFQFIRMDDGNRTPEVPKKQSVTIMRPGVPGVLIIDMAKRGVPFLLPTLVDVSGRSNAEILLKAYRDAILVDQLDLIWSDINYASAHGVRFVITDVVDARIEPVAQTSGGLVGGNHLVYASFLLQPFVI